MKVICIGDSNTWGYDPRSYFGERYEATDRWVDLLMERTGYDVINEGVNGMRIPGKGAILPDSVDLWVIMLGTNDILEGLSAVQTAEKMRLFLEFATVKQQKILLISPPALRLGAWVCEEILVSESAKLASHYSNLARKFTIEFADAGAWNVSLAFDGVHFSELGHREFAKEIIKIIRKIM